MYKAELLGTLSVHCDLTPPEGESPNSSIGFIPSVCFGTGVGWFLINYPVSNGLFSTTQNGTSVRTRIKKNN